LILSIQRTHQTNENGRYIFVVYKTVFNEARTLIQDFCTIKFKLIYSTQQQRDDYRVAVKSHPHLVAAAPPGGARAKHSAYLLAMLEKQETEKGQKYTTSSQGTWASKVIPHFMFNQNSEHPNAINRETISNAVMAQENNSAGSINSGKLVT
jgi:hypothetical protein